MNIILIASERNLSIEALTRAIAQLEKELPTGVKNAITYPVMQECLEKYNSLQQLRSCIDDFGLYCLNMNPNTKRGMELIAKQYRIREGLQLLVSGIIRYHELLDYLFSNHLNS